MIEKREIIDMASKLGLRPHVVEKDYVLGWLLWGISGHEALAGNWVFKGGTCLKKCFFETYRFSEDLDFTLIDESHIDTNFLEKIFAEIGERIYEETGIELPEDVQKFDVHTNPRGKQSCQGKIGYQGPVSPRGKNMPRVKLDLTADECIVLAPVQSSVYHPYSDMPDGGINVQSYAYAEAFGEKVRALAERTRPRDLYDVINLFRNDNARPAASVLMDVVRQKCKYKGIGFPVLSDLEPYKPDLEGGWVTMLVHQLPALPPVEMFWSQLTVFFEWLEGGAVPTVPAAYVGNIEEEVIRGRTLQLPVSGRAQSHLEIIRFAASNHLCVDLFYQNSTRRIEPYSLRRTKDGNIILHAHNINKDAHRSYRVDRIQRTQVTNQAFTPRFEIELTPTAPVSIRPTTTTVFSYPSGGLEISRRSRPRRVSTVHRSSGLGRSSGGPKYIYECTFCSKRFPRKSRTSTLNPHKDKNGYPCAGRYAHLVDTKW